MLFFPDFSINNGLCVLFNTVFNVGLLCVCTQCNLSHCYVLGMGQINYRISCVCLFVCTRCYVRNFYSILIKLRTVRQDKIEFVGSKNPMTSFPIQGLTPVLHFQWEDSTALNTFSL